MNRQAITAALLILSASSALAAGDADIGKNLFKKCMACHRIGPDAKNLVGPALTGVVGRKAGTFEGFSYSTTMKNAGDQGLVWSEDNIRTYIADPDAFLKKYLTDKGKTDLIADEAKMKFKWQPAGDTDAAKAAMTDDLLAYLASFSK